MNALIDAAFARTRVVLLLFAAILLVGGWAYLSIPKESNPEVSLPIFYVSTGLDGISPEDAEQALVEPLEAEFAGLQGVDGVEAFASEGRATLVLEFEAGFDADEALTDVREAADAAESELPDDAYPIVVTEINTALFPVITVVLSGPVPERTLNALAEDLSEAIEARPGVLEVDVGGERDEFLEVLIDPTVFETYNLSFDELIGQLQRNNLLIAAGAIETGAGRIVLKVPGLITSLEDVLEIPIKVSDEAVVTFEDVATVRRAFEDPTGFARIDGQPALALEVTKRSGANIIDTVAAVRETVEGATGDWPDTVNVTFLQDQSEEVRTFLTDLESNVIAAVILVMVVIVFALGLRSAVLVGLAIPGAFLAGVAVLWFGGYTMNIVVLFSLILVVGMLVDGAIVTTELADRHLQDGAEAKAAYARAAKRMAWPIIASTATTLSVFFPLLFWQGVIGEFMVFLPITVILTLAASLLMALVFIPVLGGLIGRRQPQRAAAKAALDAAERGDPREIRGTSGAYVRLLERALLRPAATGLAAVALLLGAFGLYAQLGQGVSFFPETEPEFMQVQVRTSDSFSVQERDALVRDVERRLLDDAEIRSLYARTVSGGGQDDEEIIGTLQLELIDWDRRAPAAVIAERIRSEMADIAGIEVQVQTESGGPTGGKPINLEIDASSDAAREGATIAVLAAMDELGGFVDVTDTRALPGVELAIRVDRSEAARFGADVSLLGQAVRLLTQGIDVADYRPEDTDGELDIRVRFPRAERSLAELGSLRVPTSAGLVPISNFVTFEAVDRVGTLRRVDERRVVTVEANVAPGFLPNDQVARLSAALGAADLPDGVDYRFGGEAEDQAEAMAFLGAAFLASVGLMFTILMVQFNRFDQSLIVMSAIVFSIAGVLLGLVITARPFGVVMGGIGIIALAGIVVNNNIVLIDTYNDLRRSGQGVREAALRSGAQRLRPVLLTSITTALGLMPMVLGMNIDFFDRELVFGAPSTQFWTELSTAIVGGLVVATLLTLIVTPALLVLADRGEVVRGRAADRPAGVGVPSPAA